MKRNAVANLLASAYFDYCAGAGRMATKVRTNARSTVAVPPPVQASAAHYHLLPGMLKRKRLVVTLMDPARYLRGWA
jgi:hypothetical protein